MPKNNESLNKELYSLLKTRGFDPIPKDATGETSPVPDDADVFKFTFKHDNQVKGTAYATIDGNNTLTVYYDDEVVSEEVGGVDDVNMSWTNFLKYLKMWAQRRQMGFDLENKDHLHSDMAQRDYVKKQEVAESKKKLMNKGTTMPNISEGYYAMGKNSSYNDNIPTVKIILQHSRQIQEGEQRYRNVARIYLENTQGERFLAPTVKPGIAQVYARHLAEGGSVNDERWNHIKSLCEEYSKMAGFVRAVRGNQFNESAQKLVEAGLNHYVSLRETLGKMRGNRGYNSYFESWTPTLMETDGDETSINELFVQETLDPRIESVMPILSKLSKNLSEVKEVKELEEWANGLLEAPGAETLAHNQSTAKSNLKAFDLEEDSVNEGWFADTLKSVGKAVLDKLAPNDKQLLLQLQRDMGVPTTAQHGKPSMARMMSDEEVQKLIAAARKVNAGRNSSLSEEEVEESGLQAYLGNKKYGKDGMDSLRKAGREGASKEKMAKIRAKYDKLDEEDVEEGNNSSPYDQMADLKSKSNSELDKLVRFWEQALEKNPNHKVANDQLHIIKMIRAERIGKKNVAENLGPEQKRVGQLGPTEKVKKNSGARGKLVGANESVEQGVVEGSTNKTLFVIYYKTGKGFDAGTGDVGILASNEQKAKEKFAKKYPHFIVTKIVEGMKYVLVDYRGNYFKGMDKFGRNLSTRNPEEAEIFNLERDAKDIALWTRNRFKAIPWSGQQGVAEGSDTQLSIQQLATISDEALDNAYGYGRSSPGNTFGWQANLMSAAYAKKMIDAGVTDIEKISDAIHKGWNVTAQKFVQNPDQFDDTEKLRQAGKLEAKLQQRAKLMKINYAQLDNEEQEKDRVVARALLQAIKNQQGVAEGLPGSLSASDYMPGATLPHTNWNCIKCSGHKFMYSLDGKLTKDNKKGAIRVKCPDCGGSGLKKPDPGHDYFGRKKEEGVAEGSSDDLVYISIDRVQAFEDWMDSEGLETNVPKTDEGTYVVYDYSNADYRSKMYASDWNEKKGVAEGFSDVVKGIKRAVKGKQHPDVVASKHAGRAIGHYNQGAIAAGDKETNRYVKTRDMHLKAKGVAEGSFSSDPADDWEPVSEIKTTTGRILASIIRSTKDGKYAYYDELRPGDIETGFSSPQEARQAFLDIDNDRRKKGVTEGEVIPFARKPQAALTWQQVPKDVLLLAADWFWADDEDGGLNAVLDPEGYGNGTANEVRYIAAKLQQKGWTIEHDLDNNRPGQYNMKLTNKRGQSVLLPWEDAQDFTGWAAGTQSSMEEGVVETKVDNYKDMGATKDTTHFVKNITTGKIVSPHRSKQDAEDALIANRRDSKDEFKIVRARKESVEEDLDANQKRVGQLGLTEKVGPKGAVGKLVGANESVEHDPLQDIKRLLGK